MSEEPTPTPSLKLKPRFRSPQPEGATVQPVGDTTAPLGSESPIIGAPAAVSAPETKIRLKPRLGSDASTPPPAAVSFPCAPAEAATQVPAPGLPQIIEDKNETISVLPPSAAARPPLVAPTPPAAPIVVAAELPLTVPAGMGDQIVPPITSGSPDAARFKLKPKSPPTVPPPAATIGAPPAQTSAVEALPPIGTISAPAVSRTEPPKPPSFPVVAPSVVAAPPAAPKRPPPVPHVEVKTEMAPYAPETPAAVVPTKRRRGILLGLAAGLALIAAGSGFWVWQAFFAAPPPPPPKRAAVAPKSQIAVPATVATTGDTKTATIGLAATIATPAPAASPLPTLPTAAADPGPTPSATLNAVAHVPINAINKTKDATSAQASGAKATNDVLAGDAVPSVPAPLATPRATKAPATSSAVTELAPGVSTTSQVDAAAEASSAFRTFVANIRVSGVAAGSAPKALINGRLVRSGEVVDAALGITFEGVKGNQLVFKDKSGATVNRRY